MSDSSIFLDLIQNAALLLALALIFDLSIHETRLHKISFWQVPVGLLIGGIGITLMMTPWTFTEGIIFDTRSVLLTISGLFLGPVPTLIAMLMTALFRLYQGGAATLTGVSVILATGSLGLLWRYRHKHDLAHIRLSELYGLGLIAHVIMLALMLLLPWETALQVLKQISLPVLFIYPIGTALLGELMAFRLRREEVNRQLAVSEERYRVLTESIKDVVWILDTETMNFRYVSPSVAQLRGFTAEEIMAVPIDHALMPEESQALKDLIRKRAEAWKNGETNPDEFFTEEVEQPCKDGSTVWTEVITNYYRNPENGHLEVRGVTRDIRERRKAQDNIGQLNAELEQRVYERTAQLEAANQELEAFAYSVSHDLRAPLRAMDGFSAALQEEYAERIDETGRHYLQRIREGAKQMGVLINDLLNLSRITRGELNPAEIDFSQLAQELASDLQAENGHREIQVEIAAGMRAYGDPRLVRIVLQNLLSNAFKFTAGRQPAEIQVGMSGENGHRTYYVRDNGVGFDMAYVEKLFMPFQRLHSVTEFPGTGIGLVTVKRIITRHGGKIWTEAAPGEGAAFYFTFGGRA